MFYKPSEGHPLPYNPFNAMITPRPIGWISTRGADGRDNLAPYSFFNAVAYVPPQVMFASTSAKADRGDTKDSVANIRETGVFCVNLVSYEMREAMNQSAGPWPRDVDEFSHTQITRHECQTIAAARVADAPASLECKMTQIITLEGAHNFAVFGEVTGVHIRPDCLNEGRFDIARAGLISRLGYQDYAQIGEIFSMTRPE
ncbi:flavin reductase family protein [Rhodobacteraceae bacterium XHP0102]|nr:flavin reductase family protein [Rhodobacteraceae bacterium XHP0102]